MIVTSWAMKGDVWRKMKGYIKSIGFLFKKSYSRKAVMPKEKQERERGEGTSNSNRPKKKHGVQNPVQNGENMMRKESKMEEDKTRQVTEYGRNPTRN